jgi:NAD(P)-dependent dehydrogenase (short-subunit alcohol dehydrogenase family)
MPTALITGAVKGIGRAMAVTFARNGYRVALNYLADDEAAGETLEEIRGFGGDAVLHRCDVADKEGVSRMVSDIVRRFGSLDVVVNNAGQNIDKPLQDMSEQDWDRVVDTNMKGVFLVCQQAAPFMLKQEHGGVIINVGATTGIQGRANGLNYCASKAGVLVMTKCLARELGPKIRVNSLIPGFTWTDESRRRFDLDNRLEDELAERKIPLHRLAEPREIAEAALFLASDRAKYISGQKLIVDGGEFMF